MLADVPETEQVGDKALFHPSMDSYITRCEERDPLVTDADAGEAHIKKSGALTTVMGLVQVPVREPSDTVRLMSGLEATGGAVQVVGLVVVLE